jgi:hypothetical protein
VSLKPSLEGLIVPSKVYSAMAAGRPVIFLGALDGEIPRMMGSGVSFGVCLAPDDAAGLVSVIEYMCDAPEPSAALGENGRQLFEEQFDQPIALEKWSALMRALGIGERAPATAAEDTELWRMDLQTCPSCASSSAHRSRSRTRTERVRRDLTAERLYRCHSCGWRGWLPPLDAGGSQGPVDVSADPDLVSLDAQTARRPMRVATASLEDLE